LNFLGEDGSAVFSPVVLGINLLFVTAQNNFIVPSVIPTCPSTNILPFLKSNTAHTEEGYIGEGFFSENAWEA